MEQKTFLVEEIFENIPGDPDNVMMKIPPEICEQNGWERGRYVKYCSRKRSTNNHQTWLKIQN